MNNFKQLLKSAGIICFALALFQVIIGFFPSLSLYFGAPEALIKNNYALILVSLLVSGILAIFGFYAVLHSCSHRHSIPKVARTVSTVENALDTLKGLVLYVQAQV